MPTLRSAARTAALALVAAGGLGSAPASAQESAASEPQLVVTETHADWEIVCVGGEAPCAMRQFGMAGDQRALQMTVRRIEARQTEQGTVESVINVAVPIMVDLTQGLRIQVDEAEPATAAYRFCSREACEVRTPVPNALVDSFKRGAAATLSFVYLASGQPQRVEVPVSLSGFTAAYEALPITETN